MTVSLYTGEEEHRPMDVEFFTPDPEVYPGKVFTSYLEMKTECPLLEQISNEVNGGYIPYTVRTLKQLPVIQVGNND